jgi:hypothetical protein
MGNYNLNVDVLQYFLPLMLALCLFEPLLNITQNISSIFFVSVLFGTFFSPLLSRVAGDLIYLTMKKRLDGVKYKKDECRRSWDYVKLDQYLVKEEIDSIYLTSAYCQFYLVNSFIFIIYGIANLLLLIIAVLQINYQLYCYSIINQLLTTLSITKTPVFDGGNMNTAVIIFVTTLLFHEARERYYENYQYLHTDLYPNLAIKYNRKDNLSEIARSKIIVAPMRK